MVYMYYSISTVVIDTIGTYIRGILGKTKKQSYLSSTKEVLDSLSVDASKGLTDAEAQERLSEYGRNSLEASRGINPLMLFFNQFKDVLIIILLISAVVSWGVSFIDAGSGTGKDCNSQQCTIYERAGCGYDLTEVESSQVGNFSLACPEEVATAEEAVTQHEEGSEGAQEAILIFAIVFSIALIGFFNEYKAEKTVEALKKLVGQKATIRRNGQIIELDAADLVPGDIVLLEEGAKVPADIRLLSVKTLYINEASLTGESLPVGKVALTMKGEKSLGDQKNIAFAGTFVTQGTAEGVVVETGQTTELGKIATLVNEVETEQTPMQRKLDDLGKKLGLFIILICVAVFVVVFLFVEDGSEQAFIQRAIFAFTAAVALAVAAIPEGLAFVVRISLALGARRMATKNALVRRLSAVEALGSTDVICSDKTGTLTKGEMTVRSLFVAGKVYGLTGSGYSSQGDLMVGSKKATPDKLVTRLLTIGAYCNNCHLDNDQILGDPTEGSLLVSARKVGLDDVQLRETDKRVDELPFTSERKKMSVVVDLADGDYLVATKGAVEKVLDSCTHILEPSGKTRKITDKDKSAVNDKNQDFASQALRVLGFAMKTCKNQPKGESDIESGLTFVGLQAMMDPPRQEVAEVIHRVQTESGIRVVMITGDYIETAKAVAKEIGLDGEAISGVDIEAMTQEEFEQRVEDISVYARVNPEHKIRIVKALKKHGHQVAMTGDGVNDAPAIKAADIGIAMGITGTDASKEAADLILLDDQFLTIIDAIEEGRGIFDNVRKFVNFLISCNIAEVLAVLAGILIFNDLILTAAQLLFINIVTDGLPAVALGSDPSSSNVLQKKPAHFQEPILNRRTWAEIFVFGTLMTVALLAQYWFNVGRETQLAAVSAAFTAMVVYELVRLVDIRTDYKIRWLSNPWLTVAIASSVVLQFAVLYFPPMAKYFGVGPLSTHDWAFMFIGSAGLFVIMKALNPVFDRLGMEG